MKRVALFSITYDPFVGGAEVAIKEFSKRIEDIEFDLFTAKLDSALPYKEKIGNVNVYRLGNGSKLLDKYLYPFRASKLAEKLHSEKSYDVIHAIMATYAGLGALLLKKRLKTIPYFLTLQSGDSDLFIWLRTWFWYPLYRSIYTKADYISSISSWLEARARNYGYKGEISIIPNGVDIEKFDIQITKEERVYIRNSWGALGTDIVLITTSRLVHKNGIDILINSMKLFPKNVKLVVVGSGKDEKKLRAQAHTLGTRVVFLGNVEHDKIPKLLKSSDAFFRLSRTEGMGNSFVEAKAAGLLVFGTNVGGIKDLISKEIVVEFNSGSVSDILKLITNNPEKYDKLRNSGIDTVKIFFSWDHISREYNTLYKKLINNNHV